jgi:polyisoprenoid-binding protein YceI
MTIRRTLLWATVIELVLVFAVAPRVVAHASGGAQVAAERATVAPKAAPARAVVLAVNAAQSKINYVLGTTLHTVHGTFGLKRGAIQIVADATSGQSGDTKRDKKMHKDVLESEKYTEVVFRPDRVDGKFSGGGAVSIQMHGTFALHGSNHELSVPVTGEITGDHWRGTGTFKIPYVEWGLKSPSNFLLKADPVVEVELELVGTIQAP